MVGSLDRPPHCDAVPVGYQRPRPTQFRPVLQGSFRFPHHHRAPRATIRPTATSVRSRPIIRSYASTAWSLSSSDTPAAIHSSRRDRNVVSDTLRPNRASTVTQEHPVTSRTRIPQKHNRIRDPPPVISQRMIIDRHRIISSMVSQTASTTPRSRARIMYLHR